ncbi:MAG: intradiol ring-cleavage dioxygenase [Actinomycetota bacterium]|nr:intradiol ring-cleavage dioxygenase [Actinomycetota bacterium]
MTEPELTRRRLLELGLALPPLAALAGTGRLLDDAEAAGPLAPTPTIVDDDEPTPELTEGPYFTPNSPRRRALASAGAAGTRLTLAGRVLTTAGKPVPRALIDFWQGDARGTYDNSGYRFRGHQLADAKGRYSLFSVVPGLYPGRTRHIHVKVQAPGEPILTTQLFFPGVPGNASDGIFDADCVVRGWRLVKGRRLGRFDFVLDL